MMTGEKLEKPIATCGASVRAVMSPTKKEEPSETFTLELFLLQK